MIFFILDTLGTGGRRELLTKELYRENVPKGSGSSRKYSQEEENKYKQVRAELCKAQLKLDLRLFCFRLKDYYSWQLGQFVASLIALTEQTILAFCTIKKILSLSKKDKGLGWGEVGGLFISSGYQFISLRGAQYIPNLDSLLCLEPFKKCSVGDGWVVHTTMFCIGSRPGRQIPWEPGNQVPTKCIGSSEFFGRIYALQQIDKFNCRI